LDERESEGNKIKIRKVKTRKIKDKPPPSPPQYEYIMTSPGSANNSSSLFYKPFINSEESRRKRSATFMVVAAIVMLDAVFCISALQLLCVQSAQIVLRQVHVIFISGDTVKVIWSSNQSLVENFITLITKDLLDIAVRSIFSGETQNLEYGYNSTLKFARVDNLISFEVKVKFLGFTFVEGERYFART
jgi:hypothetical protein